MTHTAFRKFIAPMAGLGLIGTLLAPTPALASGDPAYTAVDRYVQDQVSEARLPGLALGIVHGDQVVHTRGFGQADPSGRPVTAQTPFIIGSVSKSVTALATMQLVERGQLSLSAPVQRYLPEFRLADDRAAAEITVGQLLNHTSGIPTSAGIAPLTGAETSLAEQVRALAAVSTVSPPGQAYHYSNSDYEVLGRLIEVTSGQAYSDYIAAHVFAPLDMMHSHVSLTDARADGLASSSTLWFGMAQPHPQGAGFRGDNLPAGYIISSAADMSNYIVAQQNGGTFGGSSVLSTTGMAALHRGSISTGPAGLSSDYAMGWFAGKRLMQSDTVWHNGSAAGMHTMVLMVPASRWGVVVMTNTESLIYEFLGRIDAIADNVMAMLTSVPLVGTLAGLYTAFDVLSVLLVGLLVRRLVRLVRRGPRHYVGRFARTRNVAFNWVVPAWREFWVPLAVLIGLPAVLGAPWIGNLDTSDFGQLMLVMAGLLLTTGITRAWLMVRDKATSPDWTVLPGPGGGDVARQIVEIDRGSERGSKRWE